ncbi:MAG TPA: RsmE family RNA methyltransferase [Methylomirabilota bacterium]|nr:RsmE family RNA methyltransferase [Methylomirabilota bacterium]
MNRFFVAPDALARDRFPLPDEIAHQVTRVLRLRDGERIVLLTGDGLEVVCRLDTGRCVVEERRPAGGEPVHRLNVVQALLKGDGLDEVVQRGTEVGVAAFRLVVTERCIARDLSLRKLERLRAIARESAEQSERGIVPRVEAPVPLREAFAPGSVLLYERHRGARLGALDPPPSVLIGPEGGFTPGEVAAAEEAGVTLAGLGPRVLRSQTVAAAVAAVILSRTGDFA